ncbi:MAG: helix-turn-helix domain-containing protein [Candidatus Dormibacteraceae bacterium]
MLGIADEELLVEDLKDPEFRAEWERTALAREVAMAVVGYRVEHGLSQRALAALLGYRQPQVSRLEDGETTPSMATLIHVMRQLRLHLSLDIAPDHVVARVDELQPA